MSERLPAGASPSAKADVEAPPQSEKAQRLRLRFARGPEAADIGHLDLGRIWERAFREADIAVSYSQSTRPQPRLTIAAGLAVGVTSEGELLDVILARRLPATEAAERLGHRLPPGLSVRDAWEVGMGLPSLPSAIRWADYEVDVPIEEGGPDVSAAVASFLATESFPWEDTRGEKVRRYDLRPLVQEIRVEPAQQDNVVRLSMRLRCESSSVGRPDQVVKALRLAEPTRIHRQRLVLVKISPARDAWRRVGRFLQ